MKKKDVVILTSEERESLAQLISTGRQAASRLMHARILLKVDAGPDGPGWTDVQVAQAVEVAESTVERVRKQFAQEGLAAALGRRDSRRIYQHKLDGLLEAHLVALACGAPPEGHARWTVRLLAAQMVRLQYVESLSKDTVHRTLKKTIFSPGWKSNGASRPSRTPSSSGGWNRCWTSISDRTTPIGR